MVMPGSPLLELYFNDQLDSLTLDQILNRHLCRNDLTEADLYVLSVWSCINSQDALTETLSSRLQHACRELIQVRTFLNQREQDAAARVLDTLILPRDPFLGPFLQAEVHFLSGQLAMRTQEFLNATSHYQRAREAYRRIHAIGRSELAQLNQGAAHINLGMSREARDLLLPLSGPGTTSTRASAISNRLLGTIEQRQGRFLSALRHFNHAAQACREGGNPAEALLARYLTCNSGLQLSPMALEIPRLLESLRSTKSDEKDHLEYMALLNLRELFATNRWTELRTRLSYLEERIVSHKTENAVRSLAFVFRSKVERNSITPGYRFQKFEDNQHEHASFFLNLFRQGEFTEAWKFFGLYFGAASIEKDSAFLGFKDFFSRLQLSLPPEKPESGPFHYSYATELEWTIRLVEDPGFEIPREDPLFAEYFDQWKIAVSKWCSCHSAAAAKARSSQPRIAITPEGVFVDQRKIRQIKPDTPAFRLLQFLLTETPRTISRETMFEKIWNQRYKGSRHDAVVYQTVSRCRKYLGIQDLIQVTTGGYRANPEFTCQGQGIKAS